MTHLLNPAVVTDSIRFKVRAVSSLVYHETLNDRCVHHMFKMSHILSSVVLICVVESGGHSKISDLAWLDI